MSEKDMELKPPSYYEYSVANDIVEYLRPLWQQRGFKLREDGKFEGEGQGVIEGPWHYIKERWEFDCFTWHHILFDYFSKPKYLGYPFVPSKCHECYKVVVRPKTLKQLFLLEKVQMELGLPCKCGIEVRETVHGLYGGYFYCKGLEEGLKRYKFIRDVIDKRKGMGQEVPVILKRACTEFEIECGPSDKWQITPEQLKLEELVDQHLAKDDKIRKQPEIAVRHLHRKWIEFAYANGDGTYAEFTNGIPLTKPPVTYHHLAEPLAPDMELPIKAEVKNDH